MQGKPSIGNLLRKALHMANCGYCQTELETKILGQGFCSKNCRLADLRSQWLLAATRERAIIERMVERVKGN